MPYLKEKIMDDFTPAFEQYSQKLPLHGKSARYYKLPSTGNTPAHFYGGNGFTTGVYEPLLTELSDTFAITSLAMQGYWYDKPNAKKITREQDADALIAFLQATQDRPVVGIGHSQGATATAIAAAKRPELFSQLFLLEPVTFTKRQTMLYELAPQALKMGQEPFKSTLAKQATWKTVADYYQFLRAHRAYKRISDEHLMTYAKNSLQPDSKGKFELIFSPEQELANYFGTPFVNEALQTLEREQKVPYTIVMGKPTMFISEAVRESWAKFIPNERLILLSEYGHLLPMEAPELCADLIKQHFSKA